MSASAATTGASVCAAAPEPAPATPLPDLPEPDGNWCLPVVGETAEFTKNHYQWAHKRVMKYGPVFKSNVYSMPVTVITDFTGLLKVLGGDHKISEWTTTPSFQELMGDSQYQPMMSRDRHLKQRRQQGAAFTPDAMDSYLPRVEAACRAYLQAWAARDCMNLMPEMSALAFDFSEGLVVGIGLQGREKEVLMRKWGEFTANIFSFLVDLPGTPFNTAKRAKEYILDAIRDRVQAKRDSMVAAGPSAQRDTLLEHIMAARLAEGDDLDVAFLCETVLMLMLAGSDTSKESHKVLVGILPHLPPRILGKLREEQRGVVVRHGHALTRAAVNEMRYADATAREVLRIFGPAEVLFRKAKEDFELHGRRVRRGSTLMVSTLYAKACDPRVSAGDHLAQPLPRHMDIHRPEDSFQPERWLDDASLDTAALATFGYGVHSCLGFPLYMLEAKVLLALIARGFDVESLTGRPDWGVSPSGSGASPREDVLLKFTPRQYV